MLLVHPVRDLVRFLPALIGLLLFGRVLRQRRLVGPDRRRRSRSRSGSLRYLTTSYRITAGRIEVRHGLLNKHVLSAPLDRVRTVDLTASPIHRALGLVTLRIGTGQSGGKGEERLALDGSRHLPPRRSARACCTSRRRRSPVRTPMGHRRPPPSRPPGGAHPRPRVGAVRPAHLRRASSSPAPRSVSSRRASTPSSCTPSVDLDPARPPRPGAAGRRSGSLAVLVGICVLAVVGYLLTNFGFRLTHTEVGRRLAPAPRAVHDPRDQPRRRPGQRRQHRRAAGPPAGRGGPAVGDRDRARQEAAGQLGPGAAGAPRRGRPGRRRGARHGRAGDHRPGRSRSARSAPSLDPGHGAGRVVAAAALVTAYAVSWCAGGDRGRRPGCRSVLAHDRWHGLGHALVDGHLVARSGSLDRRREVLHTPSVIGWNLRATWFQRRGGLTDLVATTAGGRQRVRVLDLDEARGDGARRWRRRLACSDHSWSDRTVRAAGFAAHGAGSRPNLAA